MNLAQINYFMALCEAGTLTGAAAICGITQQSLSAAIRGLEHELGRPLFDRGPPVRLTPLGEAAKPHFEAILREIDKVHQLSSERLIHSGNDQGWEADPSGGVTCVATSDDRLKRVTK